MNIVVFLSESNSIINKLWLSFHEVIEDILL